MSDRDRQTPGGAGRDGAGFSPGKEADWGEAGFGSGKETDWGEAGFGSGKETDWGDTGFGSDAETDWGGRFPGRSMEGIEGEKDFLRRNRETGRRENRTSQRRRSAQRPRQGNRRRRKQKNSPVLVAIIFILAVILIAVGSVVIKKYTPTKERVDLNEYYNIHAQDDMAIIMDGQRLEEMAKYWDGHVYLDYETVRQHFNQRFYWDANENILRYTTPTDVISVNAGSKDYTVTRKNESENYVIVKVDADKMYLALDFIRKYTNIDFALYEEPNRVRITAKWEKIQVAKVRKDTEIRIKGGIKSPIVADVEEDSKVTVLETGEDWSKVYTEDGMVGYIRNKRLNDVETEMVSRDFEEPVFQHMLKEGTVSLGWHQVTNQESNGNIANVLQSTKGINVMAPTWFYLNDNNGTLYSLASKDYVNYCHQNNVEVWALVSNLENPEADSGYVLSHTSTRDNLTNQIIAAAIEYNLDGINLDFEALSAEVGDDYIQFVRELSLKCENNNLVLSIDNYVPTSYTAFYNRAEQALFADYIIIMAYDEHYSGSEDIGSAASIGFVRDGVENTLKEVPKEQTILAVPFYTRIWELTMKEGGGEDVESVSEDYLPYTFTCFEEGMQTVENRYTENGGEAVWSEEDGQYVTEYQSEGKTYKIWIENEASLEEKLKVMKENGLAGAAYWKVGLERASAWDTIIKYVN